MGWLIAIAGLLLLGYLIWKSIDRETGRRLGLLTKVFWIAVAMLVLGALVSSL